jgi:hypothetical protein
MSAPSVVDLANEVREATIRFLWRQWQAVGATVASGTQANAIVDPEVLILASLGMLEHERRLSDVIAGWVELNSKLVSIQRLGNLRDDFPPAVAERLSALATFGVKEAKDPRWHSLRRGGKAGLGERSNKVRAMPVGFGSWATLQLQLRRGMGVGAKADVLAFLLGVAGNPGDWTSVATIAAALRYTPTAVRRVADDLAAARYIRTPGSAEGDRTLQRMYSADAMKWAQLLGVARQSPGWGYWRERFLFLLELLAWLEVLFKSKVSPYARDVGARELLTRHSAAFRRDRVIDPDEFSAAELNWAYIDKAARSLVGWMTNRG